MRPRPRRARGALVLLGLALASPAPSGCATSNHGGPRGLALVGAVTAVAGSIVWAGGERSSQPGHLPAIGLGIVAAGVVGMIASGAWIAAQVSCQADPDCLETEECREIPAPPGGVPYKQCSPRQ